MKKRTWMYLLMVAMVFFAFLEVGYVQAASDQKKAPTVFRLAHIIGSTGTNPMHVQKAAREIEEFTEGRVKIEIYWGQSLLKAKAILSGIDKGICNMGWIGTPYFPAELPLQNATGNILYVPHADDAGWIARKLWEVMDKTKELHDELAKWGQAVWLITPMDGYCIFTANKPVKNLEDIKGLRIKTSGEGQAKMLSAIGGVPVFLTMPDTYTALQKGTVDGVMLSYETAKRWGIHEVVRYVTETDLLIMYGLMTVSLRDLDRISKKDRDTIFEVGRRVSSELGDAHKKERGKIKDLMEKAGVSILPFPDKEKERWRNKPEVKGLITDWIKAQNEKGRPGTKVMENFLNTFEVPR